MSKLQPKQINYFGFLFAILVVTSLHFFQIFVYPNYQPVYFDLFNTRILKQSLISLNKSNSLSKVESSQSHLNELKVICQPDCFFIAEDLEIPAIVDQDAAGRLTQLELKFFDPDHQLIGYQSISQNPTLFVINYTPDLLQTIQLNLTNQALNFSDYYSDTQQIKFKSVDKSTHQTQDYLYSSYKPELIKL